MNQIQTRLAGTLSLVAIVFSTGCGVSGDVSVDPSPAPASTPTVHRETAVSKSEVKLEEAVKRVTPKDATSPSAEATKEFRPPFPERTELFKLSSTDRATPKVYRQQDDDQQKVRLKGFVNVDRPQAMLQVDGELWIAREGESRSELTVVRVAPPSVSITRLGQRLDLSIRGDD